MGYGRRRTIVEILASAIQARLNCIASSNSEWEDRHGATIASVAKDLLPSGSGIDHGTAVDLGRSTGDKIVLTMGFHHMAESGMYDGWTDHAITVRPSFDGLTLTISGRDRNQIKEYLYETYNYALTREAPDAYQYAGVPVDTGVQA